MSQLDKEWLEQNNIDVSGALKRFVNNEALYKQCLVKFLTDSSFEELKLALSAGDYKGAFHAAHTMKGSVSNLGLNRLYEAVCPIVEKIRNEQADVTEEMKTLEIVYQETCQLIEQL